MAQIQDSNRMIDAIQKAVKAEIHKIIEEETEKAKVKAEQRIRSIADKLALKILAEYSIMDQGTHILIQVKKQ